MQKTAESLRDFEDARAGDEEALERMLTAWRGRLKVVARRQLKGVQARVDTSDVVQEGLIQAWQDIPKFQARSEGEFRSWIRRVAKGRLANTRRYHRAERRSVREEADARCLPRQHQPTSDSAYDSDEFAMVRQELDGLSDRMKAAVEGHYLEGRTFADLADTLGCTPGGARTLCERGLRKIRRRLQGLDRSSSESIAC